MRVGFLFLLQSKRKHIAMDDIITDTTVARARLTVIVLHGMRIDQFIRAKFTTAMRRYTIALPWFTVRAGVGLTATKC